MTTERPLSATPDLDGLWSALWDDLRHNATGQPSGHAIIHRHRDAIEDAARATAQGQNHPDDGHEHRYTCIRCGVDPYPAQPARATALAEVAHRIEQTYKPDPGPSGFPWRPGERDRLLWWNHAVASIDKWVAQQRAALAQPEGQE